MEFLYQQFSYNKVMIKISKWSTIYINFEIHIVPHYQNNENMKGMLLPVKSLYPFRVWFYNTVHLSLVRHSVVYPWPSSPAAVCSTVTLAEVNIIFILKWTCHENFGHCLTTITIDNALCSPSLQSIFETLPVQILLVFFSRNRLKQE